jgi:hypothetical protein
MIVLRATFDTARVKGGEWKIIFTVPQTETDMVAGLVNTCQDRLLQVSIQPEPIITIGQQA